MKGSFKAPTRIGFNAVSFEYTSNVSYSHPDLPVRLSPSTARSLSWRVNTVSDSSLIFNSFRSEWCIRPDPDQPGKSCLVDYSMEMEFANALYSAVTSKFFNFLCASVDDQFSTRCAEITRKGLYTEEFKVIEEEGIVTSTDNAD